jgi:hypothetical protein
MKDDPDDISKAIYQIIKSEGLPPKFFPIFENNQLASF